MVADQQPPRGKIAKALEPLPEIPEKHYFSISEAAHLCGVKAHVLRYWEQEFPQLRPLKRRGNRRYYQKHDLLLVRRIRSLLYGDGFTIHGARERLAVPEPDNGQMALEMLDLASPVGTTQAEWPARLRMLRQELRRLLELCRQDGIDR